MTERLSQPLAYALDVRPAGARAKQRYSSGATPTHAQNAEVQGEPCVSLEMLRSAMDEPAKKTKKSPLYKEKPKPHWSPHTDAPCTNAE